MHGTTTAIYWFTQAFLPSLNLKRSLYLVLHLPPFPPLSLSLSASAPPPLSLSSRYGIYMWWAQATHSHRVYVKHDWLGC